MLRHARAMNTIAFSALLLISATAANAEYYKNEPLFSKRPDPKASVTNLTSFGPVGMSIDLIKPNFTMRIKGIDTGSPADTAGLKPGMIIRSINGETLADIDPRIQLGNMITKAEAGNGKMVMAVSDSIKHSATREVVVQLEPMGSYSETWPINCTKSNKIVRNLAKYIKAGGNQGFGSLGMLFLLSTGDDSDLAHVRKWARSQSTSVPDRFHTWNAGLGKLALCEYYLRTGDQQVLPAIQAATDSILRAENNGGWGNRAAIAKLTYGGGGGHLNAGGVHAATFLVLAKQCGAEIPDDQFLRVLAHFYRWAGRGNVPYGNNKPEGSYTDNGKNGGLALTMAAAASLDPDGENSIYARARDISAMFAFCSTSFMLHGHTGGGIGEVFRSTSMGLLSEKQPHLYRDFMDQRRWHYEMSRQWDGSFKILGGERYDDRSWGAGYALTFTAPRKTLQLTGAPPSPHAKPFKLPKRPWGTVEDDDFESIEAIAYPDGTRPDFSKDTLASGGGMALLDVRRDGLTDEQLARYIRHPNIITRTYFAGNIAKRGSQYVLDLMNDDDARLRRLALDTIVARGGTKQLASQAIIQRGIDMIADPNESLFVKEAALRLVALAPADTIVQHIDTLVPYLNHEEWWLQHASMEALAPVVTDRRVYKQVIPALAQALRSNHVYALSGPILWGQLGKNLQQAEPDVAEFAGNALQGTYADYIEFEHPMPSVAGRVNPGMKELIAKTITKLPGGYDVLYEVTTQQSPGKALPYEELYLDADIDKFSPNLRKAVDHIIETRLIPRYIAQNRNYLIRERANEAIKHGFYYRGARVQGLVDLYRRIGIHDYDWHDFGPAPTEMAWQYHTFDPPETMAWDISKPRYREVTFPDGMANWFTPQFDPKAHGWETGLQPFGATNGKLDTEQGNCPYDFCRHGVPMKTLWDKEVLLLRGKFQFPEFKDGYRYRFVMGGMSHVGAGEGYKLYINGKEFAERNRGVGRREGAKLIGKHIDKSWWPDFSDKQVDIAAISFMGIHKGRKHRHLMIWVQEMKLPPLGDEQIIHSATVLPMTCATWQSLQDPDNNDLDPNEGKFLWDGTFKNNPAAVGKWKTVGYAKDLDQLDLGKPRDARRARLQQLELKADGTTNDPLYIWTDGTLMDLQRNEALNITVKQHNGKPFLLVEQGGFHTKHGPDWTSPWFVMKAVD